MIEINLLPGAAKKAKRGGGGAKIDFAQLLSGLSERVKDRWLAAAVVCGVVGLGAILTMFLIQSRQTKRLTAAEQQGLADSTRYATVLKERIHLEAKRDTLLRQLNIIRAIDGDRFVWPHVLEEVSSALPAYTWLTSLTYTGTPQGQNVMVGHPPGEAPPKPKKGAALETTVPLDTVHVRVMGRTVDIQALTKFMSDLEASPFFGNVTLDKSEAAMDNGIQVTDFQLTMLYTRPDSSVIHRVPLNVSVK
ncbi:MAG: PilN domain-containing protein [Gemmatimonadota bacterium]|nr:PilN domain-containing protein [Gemmatimonadota bacterium]HEU4988302.1 PilN domain-containing protein [Gemmatimonadaceae bacterium]